MKASEIKFYGHPISGCLLPDQVEFVQKAMDENAKDLACEFAEWIEKDYMAIDPKNWRKLGDTVSVIYSAKQLFAKFLEERSGK
jgi:hypothetical protein